MSWNGSGVFNRLFSWVADKAAGIDISSSRMDADTNDITANGFGNCLTRDGQGSATANLPMNGFRHTGVQNGQALTDYAALGQVGGGVINWAVATGTADAITATYSPSITTLVDGQLCFLRASAANATPTPTFTPNSGTVTTHAITRVGGGALVAGDIPAALAEVILRYNLANTRWELLNPMPVVRWAVAGGTADALTATNNPPVPALTDGQLCFVRASATNATATPSFAPDGLTAHAITKQGGSALIAGNIQNLAELILRYNLANTRWELLNPVVAVSVPPQGSFKNLSIKVATTTTVTVAADAVVTTDGTNYQTTALAGTINLGTNGAANALDTGTIAIDTWYAIWAITKPDGTTAGLASASFTAPLLPSGFTGKARIGAVQTIHSSAVLYGTWQFGRKAQYVVGLAQTSVVPIISNGIVGTYSTTSPTLVSKTVVGNGSFVPTTASVIKIIAYSEYKTAGNARMQAAPSAAYSGTNNGPGGSNGIVTPFSFDNSASGTGSACFEMTLESGAIFVSSDQAGGAFACLGWEDNI